MNFFEGLGVPLKTERGNRVFPVSDSAKDIGTGDIEFLSNLTADLLDAAGSCKVYLRCREHQCSITGVNTRKSVSYTHLDVYKRQQMGNLAQEFHRVPFLLQRVCVIASTQHFDFTSLHFHLLACLLYTSRCV